MKKVGMLITVILSISFLTTAKAATAEKPVSLKCQAANIDPIYYKATLVGPDKAKFYKLKFAYQYYGAILKYEYDLKKINKSYIGQKARVYNLTQQKNKSIRLYIETEKDGPVDMICK